MSGPGTGFTLIELLVVIALISVLASLLLPALVMAKSKVQGSSCLSNFKQMQLAWLNYNPDYPDFLAPNSDNGNEGKDLDNPAWVAGTMSFNTDAMSLDDATNPDWLVGSDIAEFGSLGPYTKNPRIYHCPADQSAIGFNGTTLPRTRSVSMNSWVGFATRDWLEPASPPYYKLNFKMSDLMNPGPAATWVFIDEHEMSINDGWFAIDMVNHGPNGKWVDLPANRHNRAAAVSFADGHCETKKWRDSRTAWPVNSTTPYTHDLSCPNNADLDWLQQRTTGLQ
jgi:prepilin-type N-terminal cleavage/methylation domain-containing protein/prepilin-type processing-associated H-X9-DG protein